jgi:hypothetical protein
MKKYFLHFFFCLLFINLSASAQVKIFFADNLEANGIIFPIEQTDKIRAPFTISLGEYKTTAIETGTQTEFRSKQIKRFLDFGAWAENSIVNSNAEYRSSLFFRKGDETRTWKFKLQHSDSLIGTIEGFYIEYREEKLKELKTSNGYSSKTHTIVADTFQFYSELILGTDSIPWVLNAQMIYEKKETFSGFVFRGADTIFIQQNNRLKKSGKEKPVMLGYNFSRNKTAIAGLQLPVMPLNSVLLINKNLSGNLSAAVIATCVTLIGINGVIEFRLHP